MLLLVVATSGAVVTRNLPTVTVASQKLPNAVILTPGTTSYRQFSATCYSALVNMTALNNSTTIQSIAFQSFFIVIILPNQPVGNTTNTSFFSPNNLLTSIALFPPSPNPIPVTMQISFNNVCIPAGTSAANDIKLAYYDGTTYHSWVPTFGPGNTITWT